MQEELGYSYSGFSVKYFILKSMSQSGKKLYSSILRVMRLSKLNYRVFKLLFGLWLLSNNTSINVDLHTKLVELVLWVKVPQEMELSNCRVDCKLMLMTARIHFPMCLALSECPLIKLKK